MITTVCKISYGSQTVPPIVPAVQGDTGRAISFEIADFTPPAGATATYFILKPSGEAIYNSATITDNSILCELTAQSLAEAGENRMQVRVLQGENIVTSFEVILMVRTFLGDNAIESGTEMNIFDQAVEQATEQFQENAEQIVAEVIESIPADYTELTEEVEQLNERLDDEIADVKEDLNYIFTDNAKTALLACLANVAWAGDNGQDYYDALEAALNETPFPKIDVVYSPGTHVVYDDDALDSLKPYITLTYYETATSTGAVIASTDYTLSGTLTDGISTITATYNNLSKAFSVTVISGRQLPTVYTWLYDATYGELLSEQSYITKTTGGDGGNEIIVNDQLMLNVLPTTNESSTNFLRFSFSDTSTTSGKLSARVKFHHVTKSLVESTSANGFRMQLSNGTAGAQVFFCSQPYSNQNLGISYFTGTTRTYVDLSAYDITEYHVVEIELKNGRQIISIDGNEIVNEGTLSTNYCTANAILNQAGSESSAPNGCVTEIDWIAYYEE